MTGDQRDETAAVVALLPGLGGDAEKPPVLGLRKVAENSEEIAAIGNLLAALEGMQTQLGSLTDLVIDLSERVDALEKKGKPKLISVRN
jgi:hypothetical protein